MHAGLFSGQLNEARRRALVSMDCARRRDIPYNGLREMQICFEHRRKLLLEAQQRLTRIAQQTAEMSSGDPDPIARLILRDHPFDNLIQGHDSTPEIWSSDNVVLIQIPCVNQYVKDPERGLITTNDCGHYALFLASELLKLAEDPDAFVDLEQGRLDCLKNTKIQSRTAFNEFYSRAAEAIIQERQAQSHILSESRDFSTLDEDQKQLFYRASNYNDLSPEDIANASELFVEDMVYLVKALGLSQKINITLVRGKEAPPSEHAAVTELTAKVRNYVSATMEQSEPEVHVAGMSRSGSHWVALLMAQVPREGLQKSRTLVLICDPLGSPQIPRLRRVVESLSPRSGP